MVYGRRGRNRGRYMIVGKLDGYDRDEEEPAVERDFEG